MATIMSSQNLGTQWFRDDIGMWNQPMNYGAVVGSGNRQHHYAVVLMLNPWPM